jgi:predicted NBD/HSP70 family sugar kinase
MTGALLVLAGLVAGLVTPAFAQPAACRAEGQVHVCRTEGFGTVLHGDTATAGDEAVIDARRRALEQVAGVQVDAETITRNQALFDQIVRTKTGGMIQAENILERTPTGDGRIRVLLDAWVKPVPEGLGPLVPELSLLVLVPETNVGQKQDQAIVENAIVSRLVDTGYRVLDHVQVQKVARRDTLAALGRGDEQAAREIRLRFLSNLVVMGEATTRFSQNTAGIVSAYARVTARVIETETGLVVANVSLDQVRGFASDPTSAGERALTAAAKPAAEKLLEKLDEYFKKKERRIEVRMRNLPSLDDYRRMKAFLEKQRWVSAVTEGGYAADESKLVLTYPEKTIYLATGVRREPRYRVLEFDRVRLFLEYRP